MRKNFGVKPWFYPSPVLIIGSYDSLGNANAMNAAWGGLYASNMVVLCLSKGHKTTKNIKEKRAFTISFADEEHVEACDYIGLVSGNDEMDKIKKAGFTTLKSEFVDAPIFMELPMVLECKLIKVTSEGNIIGEIININADEKVINNDGLIDVNKLKPITYDPVHNNYLVLGEKVGEAFKSGNELK